MGAGILSLSSNTGNSDAAQATGRARNQSLQFQALGSYPKRISTSLKDYLMDFVALDKLITDGFSQLSPQLQRAARHVLDRPDDVAPMTMRGLAASAGVHPSTMVRQPDSPRFLNTHSP